MPKLTEVEIDDRMTYHSPSVDGTRRHARLSVAIGNAMRVVNDECPEGREKALAITKLEEAKMWASAAVARNSETC